MKILVTALFCSLTLCSLAQNDSVSIGPSGNLMVFYSLNTHTQTSAANTDWHIAFSAQYISGFTYDLTSIAAAIRINEAYGLRLYKSTQKLAQYSTFDTTGWRNWTRMHNPDTSWNIGAFNSNRDTSDQFNYGWGEYNGVTHAINSDSSVYLIQLPDGSFKKFAVLNLLYDTAFNIQYANLDNSGATNMEIRKAPYSTKNFVYLNLSSGTLMDKEPALTDWDFVTLKYINVDSNPTNLPEEGVLTNNSNSLYAASGSTAQQSCYQGTGFSNRIDVIGKSWIGLPGDTVIPGLAYFIQAPTGSYKMTITAFGPATGVINFILGTCLQAGISEVNSSNVASVYPVPASEMLNVNINSPAESNTAIQVLDLSGRVILSQAANLHSGENNFPINISAIQSGNYIVSISSANGRENRMISVVK